MVTIIKPNGQLCICIDPCDPNKAIKQNHYPTRTIKEVVTKMPNTKIFSVLDASSSFWQINLDPERSKLCAFNMTFGQYAFKCLSLGLTCSQDILQRIMSEMLKDIEGLEVMVDDILI